MSGAVEHACSCGEASIAPSRTRPLCSAQGDLSAFAADSEEQQERVLAVADHDAFNWG